MWFFGRILDRGQAIGQDGGKHRVNRRSNRHHIHVDCGAEQTLSMDAHNAALHNNLSAQRLEALDVLVNRAHADVAAAGQGYFGLTVSAQ